jgi:ABC-type lipoprotein export system ATPase subunit
MSVRYPRGAEWRVWDFQVHTPHSELNNGFGADFDVYAKAFFEKAIEKGVAVAGVTDYFLVDGYRDLRAIQDDDAKLTALIGQAKVAQAKAIKLFANVELRTTVLVNGNRVNYHIIFSDELSADDIADDFLSQLNFTSEGNPDGNDEQTPLTKKNLEKLGKRLKAEHSEFKNDGDLFVGMKMAAIDHKQVSDVLGRSQAKFGGKYVLCVPCDEDLSKVSWNGQGHLIRKVLIQKSHLLFTSNAKTKEFALGLTHSSVEEYLAEFKTIKPCVHGSDAHKLDELFEPKEGRLTWVKADPTFKGLLQVINEPDSRVCIGPYPEGLKAIEARSTKIVRELSIHKKSGANLSEKWFDEQLPLNPELIAIIGNKGSGKSALADILGLIGNTPRHADFSFLSPTRFRDRKANKAKYFEASATWADHKIDGPLALDEIPAPGAVETIKYIPQDYLEKICNEVSLGVGSKFYDELQKVIFSHVPEAEQLGFSTLDELLNHRSEETKKSIGLLIEQLKAINRLIVDSEAQLTDAHRKALEGQLAAKQRELDAHDQARPPAKVAPTEDPEASEVTRQVAEELKAKREALSKVEEEVAEIRSSIAQQTKRRAAAERLLGKLTNVEKQIASAFTDAQAELEELDLAWTRLVNLQVDKAPVQEIIASSQENVRKLSLRLNSGAEDNLVDQQQGLKGEISALSEKLSAPQKEFEEYRTALKIWDDARKEIIGTAEQVGSIAQLKNAIERLPSIKDELRGAKLRRVEKVKEIYQEKIALRDDYGKYYSAVQGFLANHPLAKSQQFKLTFNVAITDQSFSEGFLRLLNQRKVGTYSGVEDGAEKLRALLDSTNFDSIEDTLSFLQKLNRSLLEDQRPGRNASPVTLKEQLANGVSASDVYDYIFSLEYLEPIYNLRWDGKTLDHLSPGERGNLLLIFYLLIDLDDIPLVIDQPEENLDNNTVFRTLVPCVKEAKKRRQIVMVTHNPNLAVVCDAEQVICAEMKKDHSHEVTYISGSIEDPLINRKIVDILEGTRPAFDKRDAKYLN